MINNDFNTFGVSRDFNNRFYDANLRMLLERLVQFDPSLRSGYSFNPSFSFKNGGFVLETLRNEEYSKYNRSKLFFGFRVDFSFLIAAVTKPKYVVLFLESDGEYNYFKELCTMVEKAKTKQDFCDQIEDHPQAGEGEFLKEVQQLTEEDFSALKSIVQKRNVFVRVEHSSGFSQFFDNVMKLVEPQGPFFMDTFYTGKNFLNNVVVPNDMRWVYETARKYGKEPKGKIHRGERFTSDVARPPGAPMRDPSQSSVLGKRRVESLSSQMGRLPPKRRLFPDPTSLS